MDDVKGGQVSSDAAVVYEEFFVPALFQTWVEPVLATASLQPGQSVLDVACGTGVVARGALAQVSPEGGVAGLDRNHGMLAVAKQAAPSVGWHSGVAEDMPFNDGQFDKVFCQFGLMFFDDQIKALTEMWRVLKPGGSLVVAVWDTLENTPGYRDLAALLLRLFGERAAEAIRAPYLLGDPKLVTTLFAKAGVHNAVLETHERAARFASIDAWMHTDVKGWTLADLIDDAQYETLKAQAQIELSRYVGIDGSVSFPAPAHIITATKPLPS